MSNQNQKLDDRIKEIVQDVMGLDVTKLDKTKKLNTISEWDSFNNLMLISKFQDDFRIEFSVTEIESTQTIADLFALLHRKVK